MLHSIAQKIQIGLFAVFCCALVAPKQAVAACGDPYGTFAVWHNFKTIIVDYAGFPHPDDQKEAGYPQALIYDNFNTRLVDAVRKNFEPCLASAAQPNTIEVLPPDYSIPGASAQQNTREISRLIQLEMDPDVLTLVIRVDYRQHWNADVIPDGVGYLSMVPFRSGLVERDEILALRNFSRVQMISSAAGEKILNKQISLFLMGVAPQVYEAHSPGGTMEPPSGKK